VVLVWNRNVKDRNTAAQLEYKIKRIGKAKKEALVSKKPRKKSLKTK